MPPKKKSSEDVQTFVIEAQPLSSSSSGMKVIIEDIQQGRTSVLFRDKKTAPAEECKEIFDLLNSSDEEEDLVRQSQSYDEIGYNEEGISFNPHEEGDIEDDFFAIAGGYNGPELPDPDLQTPEEMEIFHVILATDENVVEHMSAEQSVCDELEKKLEIKSTLNSSGTTDPVWSHFWSENEKKESCSGDGEEKEKNNYDEEEDEDSHSGKASENQNEILAEIREKYLARLGRLPTSNEERQELETIELLNEFKESNEQSYFDNLSTVSSFCRVQQQCLEKYSYRNAKGEVTLLTDQVFECPPADDLDKAAINAYLDKQADQSSENDEYSSEDSQSDIHKSSSATGGVRVYHSGANYNNTALWKAAFENKNNKKITEKIEVNNQPKMKVPQEILTRSSKETAEEKKIRKRAVKEAQRQKRKIRKDEIHG